MMQLKLPFFFVVLIPGTILGQDSFPTYKPLGCLETDNKNWYFKTMKNSILFSETTFIRYEDLMYYAFESNNTSVVPDSVLKKFRKKKDKFPQSYFVLVKNEKIRFKIENSLLDILNTKRKFRLFRHGLENYDSPDYLDKTIYRKKVLESKPNMKWKKLIPGNKKLLATLETDFNNDSLTDLAIIYGDIAKIKEVGDIRNITKAGLFDSCVISIYKRTGKSINLNQKIKIKNFKKPLFLYSFKLYKTSHPYIIYVSYHQADSDGTQFFRFDFLVPENSSKISDYHLKNDCDSQN